MKLIFRIISFALWLITVPMSQFPLFKMKTSFEINLLIATVKRGSEWEEITYLKSVKDLWLSNNHLLAILLVLLVMVLPAINFFVEIGEPLGYNLSERLKIDGIRKLVFTDIFLVSLLLIISYQIESLIIEASLGLYLLLFSVIAGFIATFLNPKLY